MIFATVSSDPHLPPHPGAEAVPGDRSARVKVLVVEDDDLVRAFIVRVLDDAGYSVASAADGREGLARFHEANPAIVVTDIVMPGMEGLEMIRELRRLRAELPILAISGGGLGDPQMYLDMARFLGARRVLAKPFDRETLLEAVASVLGS